MYRAWSKPSQNSSNVLFPIVKQLPLLPPAPDTAPGNVMIDVLNSTSLNTSWEEISPMDRNGIITVYEVQYIPLETFGGALVPNQINTSTLYLVLNDLEANVAYNISVRAYTSEGPGPYSENQLVTTPEDCKCFVKYLYVAVFILGLHIGPNSPPVTVEAEAMSSTSIMVYWEEVPQLQQNGEIIQYEVQYTPLETFENTISGSVVNTTNRLYLLEGLQEFVNYSISVRAYTSVGPGLYSDPITEQTFQDSKTLIIACCIFIHTTYVLDSSFWDPL